jgi:hypothetical protein
MRFVQAVRRNPELAKILTADPNRKWIPLIEAEFKRGEKLFMLWEWHICSAKRA